MENTAFDLFVGVDWSGAKTANQPSLRVATCEPGNTAPQVIDNSKELFWTRSDFADWMLDEARQGRRMLCGIDFSFSFPWSDYNAYFPGQSLPIEGAQGLWDVIEEVCADEEGFYGGIFADDERWRPYFAVSRFVGDEYERRLRITEKACQQQGLSAPESVFNLRGPRQVGKASLAGIRMLRSLQARSPKFSVWPFEELQAGQSVIVEAFPTAYARMAGHKIGKIREIESLQEIFTHFDAEPNVPDWPVTDDQADALVVAAALRQLSGRSDLWKPNGLSDRVRRYEGWTFGVQ